MPFERPDLETLIERNDNQFKGTLSITAIARRSFIGVISRIIAGASHLMLGFLTFIARQVFPDTAEGEFLKRWASIWGVFETEATFAQFIIEFTGTDGGVIPDTAVLKNTSGLKYNIDSEVTIAGGVASVGVTAQLSGNDYDMLVGEILSLLSPEPNVDSDAEITTISVDAANTEDQESLRGRLINRLQLPPLGGSANDYIQWAREVPGVTRAWVLPLQFGPGTVGVSFVVDNEVPIIPIPAKVTEVNDYILVRKPVTAIVTTFAPLAAPMSLDISIKPNTTDVQDSIIEQLNDLILRDANLAGSYGGPSIVNDGSILLSKIRQAVSLGIGLEDFEINLINGVAPANVVPNAGEIIVPGALAWQILP